MVHRRVGVTLGLLLLVVRPALAGPQGPGPGAQGADTKATEKAHAPATAEAMPSFGSLFTDLGGDFKNLPTVKTAAILGVGGALSLVIHPEDRSMSDRATASLRFDNAFDSGAVFGDGLFTFGTALITYGVGRASDRPAVARLGSDLFRAQVISAVMTNAVKVAVRRPRPDGGANSFPSGHTSAIFASAAVLQRHYGWKAGIPAYFVASYTGVSRLSESKHFPSDILFGAAVGLAAGHAVRIGKGSQQFAVAPMAVHGGGGIVFTRVGDH